MGPRPRRVTARPAGQRAVRALASLRGSGADDEEASKLSEPSPAGALRVGFLSVHTSPLEQPGRGDSGGMNVYLRQLSAQLAARSHDVHVFTRAAGNDLPPTVRTDEGYAVHHLPAGPAQLAKEQLTSHLCAFYLGLASHPVVGDLDVVHGHYWMSGWVGRQVARRLGIPLVQSFHTLARVKNAALAPGDAPESALRVTAEDRVVATADAILASTEDERDQLRRRYRASHWRTHVVPPGVDLATFTTEGDRAADRRALGGGRIVLFVGRLQPLKGPDLAVRTLAALRSDDGREPVRLVIAGGTSGSGAGRTDPDSLRALAAQLGVADRVAILAPRPPGELAALYRAADVVLVPSRSESFGLVALEAQACGTPVVAAGVGGLRHVVGEGLGAGGSLVEGHEPDAYAAALRPYLADEDLRRRVGLAGLRRAERFSWSGTTDRILDVYRSVLGEEAAVLSEPA